MSIINSTFVGNVATGLYAWGGGIYNETGGILYVINSTFSGNYTRKDNGGGGISNNSVLHLQNTILANSAHGYDCINTGSIATNTNNLIEDNTCSPALSGDPMLNPLADNGGPTQTMALSLDSPAIDAGDDVVCADAATVNNLDQRGIPRPYGTHCDIGAYENVYRLFRSNGQSDGWILESGENTNRGGTMDGTSITLRIGDDFVRKQYRSILSFDTSSLPDNAVVTKVTLKVRRQSVVGGGHPITDFQGFMVDIRRGTFGTPALELADWQMRANKTLGPLTPTASGQWFMLNLTSAKAYINKLATGGGLTQIRLRFKLDDNNDSVANYLNVYSGDAGAASRPQLSIEYYVP